MKAVSVIIPVYCVEAYIEECLVSVVNQTLKDIEIICVNDGTPDNSMEIVKKYAENDARIVIVNKENGGLSSARNAGLKAATGKYIYFLDSDDYILENTLERLYSVAEEHQLDSIFFDADSFFENKELEKRHQSYMEYYHRDDACKEVLPGQQFLKTMVEGGYWRPSAALQMNRREMLLENNIWFKEGIIHEDNLFSLQVSIYSKAAMHLPERFYQRRLREDSIMTSKSVLQSTEGYFVSILDAIPIIQKEIKSEEMLRVYKKELVRMRNKAASMLQQLPSDELKWATTDDLKDALLFDLLIKDYAIQSKKLKKTRDNALKEKKKLNKQIKKIQKSRSYKIGKLITAPKRILKKVLKKLKVWVDNKTKVSIIMPVYNVEKYLPECLDSLVNQTMRNIEIICVDDQSTDDSYNILKKYAKKDKRIKVYQQNHEGAGTARNLGLQYAKGEYLLFLDSDDWFAPSLCELAYGRAKERDAQIVLFAAQRKNMQTEEVEKMGWVLKTSDVPKGKTFSAKDCRENIFQITSNCPWSKLFQTKFVREHNLQFQNTKHANDTFFVRTAIALADRMATLNKVLVTYRYNEGTNTQSVKHLAPLEFYKAFIAVKERLEEEGIFNQFKKSYVNWALTESLFNYRTMQTEEAKELIRKTLINEGFEKLAISGCGREIIYDRDLYAEYMKFTNR